MNADAQNNDVPDFLRLWNYSPDPQKQERRLVGTSSFDSTSYMFLLTRLSKKEAPSPYKGRILK